MRAGLSLTTPPGSEPLTLAQLKSFLRVEVSTDDALITEIGQMARDYIEDHYSFAFIDQVWDQQMDAFPYPNQPMDLLKWPVTSIVSIKYTDFAGGLNVLAPATYVSNLKTKPPRVGPQFGQYWPILALAPLAAVVVQFKAGLANAAAVAPRFKQGIYMLAAHWYENREAVITGTISSEIQLGLDDIFANVVPPAFA